jgi:hypothetical protein
MMISRVGIDVEILVMDFMNVSIKKRNGVKKAMCRIMTEVKHEFVGKTGRNEQKKVCPEGFMLSGQCDGDKIGQGFNPIGS